MTRADLVAAVRAVILDPSFSDDDITGFLNQAAMEIAGRHRLKSLETENTVTTDDAANEIPLPGDYLHGLYLVEDAAGIVGDPAHYDDVGRFKRRNPQRASAGRIVDVAVGGGKLYYAQREAKTLTLSYFTAPTPLSIDTDEPTWLEPHLHRPLLVNYAAFLAFDQIEDGIDDPKVNARHYLGLYNSSLPLLAPYLAQTDGPAYLDDAADSIFMDW